VRAFSCLRITRVNRTGITIIAVFCRSRAGSSSAHVIRGAGIAVIAGGGVVVGVRAGSIIADVVRAGVIVIAIRRITSNGSTADAESGAIVGVTGVTGERRSALLSLFARSAACRIESVSTGRRAGFGGVAQDILNGCTITIPTVTINDRRVRHSIGLDRAVSRYGY